MPGSRSQGIISPFFEDLWGIRSLFVGSSLGLAVCVRVSGGGGGGAQASLSLGKKPRNPPFSNSADLFSPSPLAKGKRIQN